MKIALYLEENYLSESVYVPTSVIPVPLLYY